MGDYGNSPPAQRREVWFKRCSLPATVAGSNNNMRPNPHRTRDVTHNAMQANGTC